MVVFPSHKSGSNHNLNPGKYVVVGVVDTGTGMSEDVLKNATEPFFTTKEVGKGTGLGLSQCRGFAEQSGGTLLIESKEGSGTTVRMFFPTSQVSRENHKPEISRTILLVDDELAIRDLVGEMLRTLGHTVFVAEDSRDALEQLKKNVTIDCLFTDIIMPGSMNGLQLVDEARVLKPNLLALLASGYSREALRKLAQLKDDVSFIQKPYSLSQISLQIDAAADSIVRK